MFTRVAERRNALLCGDPSTPIRIPEHFRMKLFGLDEAIVECNAIKSAGNRLLVKFSAPIPLAACIRIDCDDAILLGEIAGSWLDGTESFGVIELQHTLRGVSQLHSDMSRLGLGKNNGRKPRSTQPRGDRARLAS